jgi:hypothetical protein
MDHRWPRLRRGPERVRSALTIRISPSCANPAAPTPKSRSSTFLRQGPRCCSWCRSQGDQCRRNSESHGRGVVRPERPPVDSDLRRAISRARRSYLPRCAISPENTVWRWFRYPWKQRRRPSVSRQWPTDIGAIDLGGTPRPRRDCNCGARSPLRRPLRSAHGDLLHGDNLVSRASVCT